ncbi:MAG: glycosyltransferase family 2 protein [Flavobacteriales bacterium]|nr:glycosyltransferase family 2 protein [Flavobacteriales bacterium]
MISVIAPVYNESANLEKVYGRLIDVLQKLNVGYEIVFVNDGSKDDSMAVIHRLAQKDASVKYVNFSRNFGHQIAVCAGLDFVKGDKVVIMDTDGQDPPEIIEKLYLKSLEGFEVVYARRIQRKGENVFKKLTARWFYRIMQRITHIDIPVDTGDFRIIDKKVVEQLRRMPERQKFLRGQISWIGFNQTSVEFEREARLGGKTGYSLGKMIRLALDGITGFSNFPLRLATLSGFVFALIGFGLILYTLYSRFARSDYEPGWASQMITIVFIGGIQLIGIGIIGEYISRISDNVRNRPLYIIRETNIH